LNCQVYIVLEGHLYRLELEVSTKKLKMLIIKKSKIRSVKSHLPDGLRDQEFYVSVNLSQVPSKLLSKIG
jgi:hypothetical protein